MAQLRRTYILKNKKSSATPTPSEPAPQTDQPERGQQKVQDKLLEQTDNPALRDLIKEVIRW